MLTSDRNRIIKKLLKYGYSPTDFEIKEDRKHENTYHLYYKKSKMRFGFMYEPEQVGMFSVGYSTCTPKIKWINNYPFQRITFDEALKYLGEWLVTHLKRYIEEQGENDLWTIYKSAISTENKTIYENYTTDQQRELTKAINGLGQKIIKEFDANKKQQKVINERIEYLSKSVNKNKIDFMALFLQSTIDITLWLALDEEQIATLKQIILNTFSTIESVHLLHF